MKTCPNKLVNICQSHHLLLATRGPHDPTGPFLGNDNEPEREKGVFLLLRFPQQWGHKYLKLLWTIFTIMWTEPDWELVWPIIFCKMPQNGIKVIHTVPMIPLDMPPMEAMGVYVSSSWIWEMASGHMRPWDIKANQVDWSSWIFLGTQSLHALRKPKQSQEKDTCQCSGNSSADVPSGPLPSSTMHVSKWVCRQFWPRSSLSSFQLRSQTLMYEEKPSLLCPLLFLTLKYHTEVGEVRVVCLWQ